ncbi:MAG: outer membrane beta-barrel protein, partial [Deltaproteobacteria bacterium]
MSRVAALLVVLVSPVVFADEPVPAPALPAPAPVEAPPDPNAAKLRELEHRLFVLEHPVPPVKPPESPRPLDVREPTFGEYDFSWMNGNNSQPASLLQTGPVTMSLYIDTYYGYQFHEPIDHTVFPTTTAPRHDEISLNLAHLGMDVTGLDGPIGRLYIQYGSTVETIAGQDTTTTRGFYLTNRLLQNVQQAAVGWHFHRLHGINAEVGIFPSYVGLESYL